MSFAPVPVPLFFCMMKENLVKELNFQSAVRTREAKYPPKYFDVRLMNDFEIFGSQIFCRLSIMVDKLKELNSISVLILDQFDCENFALLVCPLHQYYLFFKFYIFVGHRLTLALFHSLILLSKELFHSFSNRLQAHFNLLCGFFHRNFRNAQSSLC